MLSNSFFSFLFSINTTLFLSANLSNYSQSKESGTLTKSFTIAFVTLSEPFNF